MAKSGTGLSFHHWRQLADDRARTVHQMTGINQILSDTDLNSLYAQGFSWHKIVDTAAKRVQKNKTAEIGD